MAQKFGNGRWVREGFLDNRIEGTVVGTVTFAVIGAVDVYLRGNFRGEIAGRVIQFRNSRFEDDDLAGHILGDLENPQMGEVNLISFDPHPNLTPRPYIEWFSLRKNHYRIELDPSDAWIVRDADLPAFDQASRRIRQALESLAIVKSARDESDWV
jgi:hypothetical protein